MAQSRQLRTVYSWAVQGLPEYVAISPIALACPRCQAKPGDVCEVLIGGDLEIVQVERIKLALAMDAVAKDRFDRGRIPYELSE